MGGLAPKSSACGRDRRGVVYVEFLIAFLPVLLFFSGVFQLGVVEVANLVTQHAATTAARAAIVVLPDDPTFYDDVPENSLAGQDNKRRGDITDAARMTLAAIDSAPQLSVTFPSRPGGTDDRTDFGDHDVVYAQVHYSFPCRVPIGNRLVCGLSGIKDLVGESGMPNQGATRPPE